MGYNLYVTRARFWVDNVNDRIEPEEWLDLVEGDSEMRLDHQNGPYFVVWNRALHHGESWLDWSDGNVFTKNPDPVLIDKLLQVATKLNAVVQGEGGEVISGSNGIETSNEATHIDRPITAGQDAVTGAWWRRLLK